MFGFFKKSKSKEVTNIVLLSFANAYIPSGNYVELNDPDLIELAQKITPPWLDTLPSEAIDNCQAGVLAAFVLVSESQLHAKDPGSRDLAQLYIEAAKLATKGLGFRAAADQLKDAEYKLLIVMAKMAQSAGLSFYEDVLEEIA